MNVKKSLDEKLDESIERMNDLDELLEFRSMIYRVADMYFLDGQFEKSELVMSVLDNELGRSAMGRREYKKALAIFLEFARNLSCVCADFEDFKLCDDDSDDISDGFFSLNRASYTLVDGIHYSIYVVCTDSFYFSDDIKEYVVAPRGVCNGKDGNVLWF